MNTALTLGARVRQYGSTQLGRIIYLAGDDAGARWDDGTESYGAAKAFPVVEEEPPAVDPHARAHADGYAAYGENRPAAPSLSPVVRELIEGMAVGTGAVAIFAAFTHGYNQAAEVEFARTLAD